MGKRKTKGRQKETRNANRMGGTSTRPDGRVDAYLTIDTPTGPYRMRTTKATQEKADAWLLEARYLASQGAFASLSYDYEDLTVAKFVGCWLEDEVMPTVRAVTFAGYEQTHRLRILPLADRARRLLSVRRRAALEAWLSSGRAGAGRTSGAPSSSLVSTTGSGPTAATPSSRIVPASGGSTSTASGTRRPCSWEGTGRTSRRRRGSWGTPTPGLR